MRCMGDLDTWVATGEQGRAGRALASPAPTTLHKNRPKRRPLQRKKKPQGAHKPRDLRYRTLYWGLGVAGLAAGFAVVAGLAAGLAAGFAGAAAAAPMRVADLMVSSLGQCWARYFSPPLEMFSWSMPEPSPYWS